MEDGSTALSLMEDSTGDTHGRHVLGFACHKRVSRRWTAFVFPARSLFGRVDWHVPPLVDV